MSLIVKGNASSAIDIQAGSIAVSSPRKYYTCGSFVVTANEVLPSPVALMRFGPSNSGTSVSVQAGGAQNFLRIASRVIEVIDEGGSSSSPIYSAPLIPITLNQRYDWEVYADYDAGYIRHYVNKVIVAEHTKEAGKTWNWHSFPAQAAVPRIQGASVAGFDFEVFDFIGRIGAVLTPEEVSNFSFDDDLSGLSAPPTWGVEPLGEPGSHASVIEDIYGSNDMTQIAGPTPPTSGFPYFAGEAGEDILTDVVATSTARTITVSGQSSVSDGTVYIIVDKSSNYSGVPEFAEIKAGLLDDGETSAAFRRSVSMLEQGSFSETFVVGEADSDYTAWIYQDTDDDGANSNKASASISTKRPVIKPAGSSIWYGLDRSPLVSENGMVWKVVGSNYTKTGFSTDTNARGEIDLTEYVNGGATKDIGDTIDVIITRSNGETLAALGKTIVDGGA